MQRINTLSTLALLLALGPVNGPNPARKRPALDALNAAREHDSATCELIGEAMDELHAEGKKLLAVNVADRTDYERDRVKGVTVELRQLRAEYDARNLVEINARDQTRAVQNAVNGGPRPSPWRDAAGRPVNVLRAADRMTDLENRAGDNAGGTPSVGALIKGAITGDWADAETEQQYYNLSTTVGSSVMIPSLIGSQIIDLARAGSAVIRAGAATIPMNAPTMKLVKVTSDPTVAGVAENATIGESDPGIGGITFTAKKMGCIVRVSNELLYDASNAGALIENILSTAMGAEIDRQALEGDGTGQNLTGLLSMAGVNDVDAGGVYPNWANWLAAVQAIEEANGTPAATVMSPGVKAFMNGLTDTTGRYLDPPSSLSALQRYTSTKLADTVAIVGDFTKLLVGVWKDVQIDFSAIGGDAFTKDQTLFRVLWRGDVAATHPGHLAKITDIDTATAPS